MQAERAAFSINEIAYQVGVGRNKIYDAIADNELQTIKVGRRRLITFAQRDRWIKRLEEKSGGAA